MRTKHRHLKKPILRMAVTGLFLIGYGLLVVPCFFDQIARLQQTSRIAGFLETTPTDLTFQLDQASQYNQELANLQKEIPFTYGSFEAPVTPVDSIFPDGKLGMIRIESIHVNLLVEEGTSDEVLVQSAGHLSGTSLPTGDSYENGLVPPSYGTHCVIAAHTALKQAELFSRLDELELGDIVELVVCNETHRYEVKEINVVIPEKADAFLQIVPNLDQLTLYTCTPYGINSHRLLVRCERIEDPIVKRSESGLVETDHRKAILFLCVLLIVPVGIGKLVNGLIR